MPEFNLKRESLNTITDVEIAFGTTKLLPPFDAVPDEFKRGNDYTRLLDHLFSGQPLPDGEIVFREGFDDTEAPALLNRVVMAHLRSFEPNRLLKYCWRTQKMTTLRVPHPLPGSK